MTVLQLRGPMGLRVLQWCHPMLACSKRKSYCTRIITLYGARKVDLGLRNIIITHNTPYSTCIPQYLLYSNRGWVGGKVKRLVSSPGSKFKVTTLAACLAFKATVML